MRRKCLSLSVTKKSSQRKFATKLKGLKESNTGARHVLNRGSSYEKTRCQWNVETACEKVGIVREAGEPRKEEATESSIQRLIPSRKKEGEFKKGSLKTRVANETNRGNLLKGEKPERKENDTLGVSHQREESVGGTLIGLRRSRVGITSKLRIRCGSKRTG